MSLNTETEKAGHGVVLRDRARLEMDGVQDVTCFDENSVVLLTALGGLTVEGDDLHIESLDPVSGRLVVSGRIGGLFYTGDTAKKKGSFLSRLVK